MNDFMRQMRNFNTVEQKNNDLLNIITTYLTLFAHQINVRHKKAAHINVDSFDNVKNNKLLD